MDEVAPYVAVHSALILLRSRGEVAIQYDKLENTHGANFRVCKISHSYTHTHTHTHSVLTHTSSHAKSKFEENMGLKWHNYGRTVQTANSQDKFGPFHK